MLSVLSDCSLELAPHTVRSFSVVMSLATNQPLPTLCLSLPSSHLADSQSSSAYRYSVSLFSLAALNHQSTVTPVRIAFNSPIVAMAGSPYISGQAVALTDSRAVAVWDGEDMPVASATLSCAQQLVSACVTAAVLLSGFSLFHASLCVHIFLLRISLYHCG